MKTTIDLISAIAWPLAFIIIAGAAVAIVWRLTGKGGLFKLNIKDWVNFERGDAPKELDRENSELVGTSQSSDDPKLDTVKELSSETVEEAQADKLLPESVRPFMIEDDVNKLSASFEEFKKSSEAYNDDPEFWESFYVDKRRELGLADEETEFTNLAQSNPQWVWPLIFLVRRYIRLHDSDSAEKVLQQAISRQSSENHQWVLAEGVSLYYELFGFERAMKFVREQYCAGLTDKVSAALFRKLAVVGKKEDVFSKAILSEVANNLDLSNNDLFDLAYLYGAQGPFKIISFERYRELLLRDGSWPHAANNMGVIVDDNKPLEIHYFESSLSSKSAVAYANLARNLASDGYVDRAEKLLAEAPEQDSGTTGHQTMLEAQARVSKARVELDAAKLKYERFAADQDKRYKALIFASLEYFKACEHGETSGAFVSDDKQLGILITNDIQCVWRIGDNTLSGTLSKKPLCYEGIVSHLGKGGLLDYSSRHVLAVRVSDEKLRVVIWPYGLKLDSPLQIIELSRIELDENNGTETAVTNEGLLSGLLNSPKK